MGRCHHDPLNSIKKQNCNRGKDFDRKKKTDRQQAYVILSHRPK
jgi:hypothetical protein